MMSKIDGGPIGDGVPLKEDTEKTHGESRKKSEYEVGYGKPPKAHQFQPGRSGNAKGRRKRVPSVSEQLQAIMFQKVTVSEAGQRKRMTRQEVMLRSIVNSALKGDLKSANFLLSLLTGHRDNASTPTDQIKLTEESSALLQEYMRQLQAGEESTPISDIQTELASGGIRPNVPYQDSESHHDDGRKNLAQPEAKPAQPAAAAGLPSASDAGRAQSIFSIATDQPAPPKIFKNAPVQSVENSSGPPPVTTSAPPATIPPISSIPPIPNIPPLPPGILPSATSASRQPLADPKNRSDEK